jgi:hypothetical protein
MTNSVHNLPPSAQFGANIDRYSSLNNMLDIQTIFQIAKLIISQKLRRLQLIRLRGKVTGLGAAERICTAAQFNKTIQHNILCNIQPPTY